MTQETETVSQRAREAAASIVEWQQNATKEWSEDAWQFFHAKLPQGIREGVWDNHNYVQAFARFERELSTNKDETIANLEAALVVSRQAVHAFLDMVNVMGRVGAVPIPAILGTAQHNCPIILDQIDAALTSTKKEG